MNTTTVCIEMRRSDLRGLVSLIGRGEYVEAAYGLATLLAKAGDLDVQTLGAWVDYLAHQLEARHVDQNFGDEYAAELCCAGLALAQGRSAKAGSG